MSREHRRVQRWIEQDLLGELPRRNRTRLRDHLRGCERCRARHDRTVAAFRVLEEADTSEVELEQVGAWLADELADREPVRERGRPRLGWIGALGSAVTAMVVLLVWWPSGSEDEFAAKGAEFMLEPAPLAVDVLCGTPPRPAGDRGCDLSEELGFAYRVEPGAANSQYLSLFGVDAVGDVLYYTPTPIDSVVGEVAMGSWETHSIAVNLGVNHRVGQVRVYGLIAPVPATVEDVDAWAARLRSERPAGVGDPSWLERVPSDLLTSVCPRSDDCAAVESAFSILESAP